MLNAIITVHKASNQVYVDPIMKAHKIYTEIGMLLLCNCQIEWDNWRQFITVVGGQKIFHMIPQNKV